MVQTSAYRYKIPNDYFTQSSHIDKEIRKNIGTKNNSASDKIALIQVTLYENCFKNGNETWNFTASSTSSSKYSILTVPLKKIIE